jgi:serine-aspartate repeat-containing protein C/D/E
VGLLNKISGLGQRWLGKNRLDDAHVAVRRPRRCQIEEMESRRLMVADLHVGAVYYEPASGLDSHPNVIQISFAGGAPGTQLTHLDIDGNKDGGPLSFNDAIFDTAAGGLGSYGFSPLSIVSHDGFQVVASHVVDGDTKLSLDFQGFQAGMKLVLSIDADQVLFIGTGPERGDVEVDSVVEGAEFQRSHFVTSFSAPHYEDITTSTLFWDQYDGNFAAADRTSQSQLDLPADRYSDPSKDQSVLTAGAVATAEQVPKPNSIAGVVYSDHNLNNHQDAIDQGIGGVNLTLLVLNGANYVPTGLTTITDSQGAYKFDGLAIGTYRVVETQPSGYFSVGATPGTVDGQVRGVVLTPDILDQIGLLGGDNSIRNDFAEAVPNSIRGHVGNDTTGDCDTNPNTPGIAGVVMHLVDSSGRVLRTTTTDQNGDYFFDNLPAGNYTVLEEQPAGWLEDDAHVGSAGGVVFSNDEIRQIVLTTAIDGVHYDFCEVLPVSISGFVHIDTTGDCENNPDAPPIAGVIIQLLDSAGHVIGTTTTDAQGHYIFDQLAPGTYGVHEVQPAGYFDGDEHAGSVGGNVSDDLVTQIVLLSGVHAVDYDFCELLPVSVSGFVHVDTTGDCENNPDAPPIAGVVIQLLDSAGHVIGTTTTDAQGHYIFDQLAPGTYGVHEVQPAGYFDGDEHAGSAGGTVSDDLVTNIVLMSGVQAVDYDFCELLPVSVSGFVRVDTTGDCENNPDAPPIAGVVIQLLDSAGHVIGTTTTDAQGHYIFDQLAPGTYGVHELQPAGYFDGDEHAGSAGGNVSDDLVTQIVLMSGVQAVNYDFCELLPVSISGFVHVDTTGDCENNPNDPPLAGVVIQLLDSAGHVIGTTTTDAQGHYIFDQLAPGTYGVHELQPAAYFDGDEHAGSAGGTVSDDLVTNIVLMSGVQAVDYDFCEVPPASLCGYVYSDLNNDGHKDPGEAGIANVTLVLLDANGQPTGATAITDANGLYCFMGLRAGTYGVSEIQPPGYYDGLDTPGDAGGTAHNPGDLITGAMLMGGAHAENYNFGELLPASIEGFVHIDTTGDCENTPNAPGLAGVTIHLLDSQGNVIGTTTDAKGHYSFNSLPPATYGVREEQPAGYFDDDEHAGSAGGTVSDDLVTNIVLGSGIRAVDYDFCETPPGSLSGYVFQDGPPIEVEHAGDVPNVLAQRDGKLTSDDTRLPGVTLELRDGVTGLPILGSVALAGIYAADQPIRTTTDANGHYVFYGLPPGTYAVYDVKPEGYFTGIDTPGSMGGMVVSSLVTTDPAVLSQLVALPHYDALVGIALPRGGDAVNNNFSVVVTTVFTIEILPPQPLEPPPLLAAGFLNPLPPLVPPPNSIFPYLVQPQLTRTGGALYTWHLSVVDAGQPRDPLEGDQSVQLTAVRPGDEVLWQADELADGEWDLPGEAGGPAMKTRKLRFGLRGGIPISGDFNGDGKSEVGVFKDGRWFIDLNDNGVWDEGDLWAKLGHKGDRPVTGDWDGDGKTDIGIYGPAWPGDPRAVAHEPGLPDPNNENTEVHKNVPRQPNQTAVGKRTMKLTAEGKSRADLIDHVFFYGTPGDHPVVGDWNGDGTHTIAVFRDGVWRRDTDGDGKWSKADVKAHFGQKGDLPVVGDFNGDGVDELGVYRDGTWLIDTNGNGLIDGEDRVFHLGGAGDVPIVGDWNGDGVAEPGVYHESSAPLAQAPAPAK